ncbi:hypothetical protein StrepF001_00575 [Streptomyces sp. F001]|nr:hypothetical protein StrepF001_00575 [Streptomyces sp. F001]
MCTTAAELGDIGVANALTGSDTAPAARTVDVAVNAKRSVQLILPMEFSFPSDFFSMGLTPF